VFYILLGHFSDFVYNTESISIINPKKWKRKLEKKTRAGLLDRGGRKRVDEILSSSF